MILTKENYYSTEANQEYMSFSQYKSFEDCEAMALAKVNGKYVQPDNDAFMIGKYVHAWCEGTLDNFIATNTTMFKKDGTMYKKYEDADKYISVLKNDKIIMNALEGEKEVIMTGIIHGVKFKVMIDVYNRIKGRFCDLKTVKNFHDKSWDEVHRMKVNFIQKYKYILQLAIYADVEKQNRENIGFFEPYIVAVSKEDVPNRGIIVGFKEYVLFEWIEAIKEKVIRFQSIKEGKESAKRCGYCDWCKMTKTNVIYNWEYL